MTGLLIPNGKQTFLDQSGVPLAGGTVTFYVPGTTTPKDTFQDADLQILNTNPVQLDAAGTAVIWGAGSYRQIVMDSNGVTVWDQFTTVSATADTLPPAVPGSSIEAADFQVTSTITSYFCDPTSNPITATLPAVPLQNAPYMFKDYTGQASPTHPIGLNGNGYLIDGQASISNFIQVAYGFGAVQFNGTSWSVVS
jgi:hypothetical protein